MLKKLIAWTRQNGRKLLDTPILAVGMAVDFLLVMGALLTLSHVWVERLALIPLAVIIVGFSVRGWAKGGASGKILFFLFAFVSVSLDTSYVLAVTEAGTKQEQNPEIVRIDSDIADSKAVLVDLRSQYKTAVSKTNIENLDGQIKDETFRLAGFEADRKKLIESQGLAIFTVTSQDIGMATLRVIRSGEFDRWFWLVICCGIFIGMQFTFVSAIKGEKDRVKEQVKIVAGAKPAKKRGRSDDISRFVHGTWVYIRNGRGQKAVPKQSFFKSCKTPFAESLYDDLLSRCVEAGFIADGKIVEKDEEKVIGVLTQ